jgi:hypothetical protein
MRITVINFIECIVIRATVGDDEIRVIENWETC